MGTDFRGERFCDHCGRPMAKAVRIHLGAEYCRSCYQTQFHRAKCTTCEGPMRAHRRSTDPVCAPCQRAERLCQRCGRLTPIAARIVQGKPVCKGCAAHFNPERVCNTCGQRSKRLFRVLIERDGGRALSPPTVVDSQLECQPCRNKATHATCATCRRHRKVMAISLARRPLCADCAATEPTTHECPACGKTVVGGGHAICLPCGVRASAIAKSRVLGAALEHAWARDAWRGFSDSLIGSDSHVKRAARVLDASLSYFEKLDDIAEEIGTITVGRLHESITSADHRRHLLAYRYVLGRIGEDGAAEAREEAAEAKRLDEVLSRAQGKRYEALVVAYVRQLRACSLAGKTVRLYAGVAQSFCERARVGAERPWTDAAIKTFLQQTPGAANSLSRFVSFSRHHLGWDVRMPSKGEWQHDQARATRDVERLRRTLRKLGPRPVTELKLLEVARVISVATGVPMRTLSAAKQVSSTTSGGILVSDDAHIEPGHRLYAYALRWQQLIARRFDESLGGGKSGGHT